MNLIGFLYERPDGFWQWALFRNFNTRHTECIGFGLAETHATASVLLEACKRAVKA